MLEPWAEISERLRRNFKLMHYLILQNLDYGLTFHYYFATVRSLPI